MDVLLRRLTRAAARRGLSGDGWPWLLLGAAAFALHRARRDAASALRTVTLHPGDEVVVAVSQPPRRRASRGGRERQGGAQGATGKGAR